MHSSVNMNPVSATYIQGCEADELSLDIPFWFLVLAAVPMLWTSKEINRHYRRGQVLPSAFPRLTT